MVHHDFTTNPSANLFISIILALTGNILGTLENAHIPLIVMQFFQVLAWFSAFIIMLVTLYKTFKEKKNNKQQLND